MDAATAARDSCLGGGEWSAVTWPSLHSIREQMAIVPDGPKAPSGRRLDRPKSVIHTAVHFVVQNDDWGINYVIKSIITEVVRFPSPAPVLSHRNGRPRCPRRAGDLAWRRLFRSISRSLRVRPRGKRQERPSGVVETPDGLEGADPAAARVGSRHCEPRGNRCPDRASQTGRHCTALMARPSTKVNLTLAPGCSFTRSARTVPLAAFRVRR